MELISSENHLFFFSDELVNQCAYLKEIRDLNINNEIINLPYPDSFFDALLFGHKYNYEVKKSNPTYLAYRNDAKLAEEQLDLLEFAMFIDNLLFIEQISSEINVVNSYIFLLYYNGSYYEELWYEVFINFPYILIPQAIKEKISFIKRWNLKYSYSVKKKVKTINLPKNWNLVSNNFHVKLSGLNPEDDLHDIPLNLQFRLKLGLFDNSNIAVENKFVVLLEEGTSRGPVNKKIKLYGPKGKLIYEKLIEGGRFIVEKVFNEKTRKYDISINKLSKTINTTAIKQKFKKDGDEIVNIEDNSGIILNVLSSTARRYVIDNILLNDNWIQFISFDSKENKFIYEYKLFNKGKNLKSDMQPLSLKEVFLTNEEDRVSRLLSFSINKPNQRSPIYVMNFEEEEEEEEEDDDDQDKD